MNLRSGSGCRIGLEEMTFPTVKVGEMRCVLVDQYTLPGEKGLFWALVDEVPFGAFLDAVRKGDTPHGFSIIWARVRSEDAVGKEGGGMEPVEKRLMAALDGLVLRRGLSSLDRMVGDAG